MFKISLARSKRNIETSSFCKVIIQSPLENKQDCGMVKYIEYRVCILVFTTVYFQISK